MQQSPSPSDVSVHAPIVRFAQRILCIAALFCIPFFASAVFAAPTVVKPSSLNNWGTAVDSGAPPLADFTAGPGTPPAGTGSARLRTPNSADGVVLGTQQFSGLRLSDITALEYSTYRVAPEAGVVVPALQINIDYDLTDANAAWQGRLIYEPYQSGATPQAGVWQTWDALSGNWWASGAPGNSVCTMASTCTWAQVLANWPDAGVQAGALSGVLFKAGSSWPNFEGHVDSFVLNTTTQDYSFDFEPETLCSTTCYVDAVNGDDSFGGDTLANPVRTIQTALNRVATGGTVIVAAGSYPEALSITQDGVTLEGAGAGTDPVSHTIIAGPVATNSGIRLPNAGTTDVTIRELRVQNFSGGGICSIGANNDNLTIQGVHVVGNTAGSGCLGGIYANGPIQNVTITQSLAENNTSRGIVIWNGFKQDITISDNIVRGNNCCGIELQDGTASGVTITGNTITDNGDNGIGVTGLRDGAGPNLIAGNTLTNNGRFGIEVKLPDGTGLSTGDGSIVVENNTVSQDASFATLRPSEERDIAGIAVFRRGWLASSGNVDLPTGVIVRNNQISGYIQDNGASLSTGFGIVVEGANHTVTGNTLTNNDVGLQRQAGHLPYAPNTSTDGDQADLDDTYFGRGNAPVTCGVTLSANSFVGNGIDERAVGGDQVHERTVTNTDTGAVFCSIQAAIDAPETLAGHTLNVSPGTFAENVQVTKALMFNGPNTGISPNTATRGPEAIVVPAALDTNDGNVFTVSADNVLIDGLTIDGNNPAITSGRLINGVDVDTARGISTGDAGGYTLVQGLQVRNNRILNFERNGLMAATDGSAASTGNVVADNLFDNMPRLSPNGRGISLIDNFYADVTDNVISRAYIGIQTNNFYRAAAEAQISRNTLSTYRVGIFHNLHYQNAATFSIADNTFTTADYAAWSLPGDPTGPFASNANVGLWLASIQSAVGVNVQNPTVTEANYGILAWNLPTSAGVTIQGGTLTGNTYGVALINCSGSFGAGQASSLTLDGLRISDSAAAAVDVYDNVGNCAGAGALDLTIQGATTISGGEAGLLVRGANVTAAIGDSAFAGQSGDYITLDTNANDIDARAARFAGQLGRELSAADFAAVQAKLTDQNDNPALGLVILADTTLVAAPDTLDFSGYVGGPSPADQTLTLQNVPASGSAIATWEISAISYGAGASDWLSCTPSSGGPLAIGASVDLTCTATSAALTQGSYTAEITLAATDPGTAAVQVFPATLPVTLTLLASPQLSVSPSELSFSALVGAALPPAQTIQLSAAAGTGAALDWTLSDVPEWLACAPMSGNLAPAATESVSCRPNTTATVGDLSATLAVRSTTPGVLDGDQSIAVQYVVTATPAPLFVSIPAPGATIDIGDVAIGSTATAGIELRNTGTADLTVSAPGGATVPFSVTPATAVSLAPGAIQNVQISCAPTSTGSFTATLTYTTDDPGQSLVSYTLTCTGTSSNGEPLIHQMFLPFIQAPPPPAPAQAARAITAMSGSRGAFALSRAVPCAS